MDITSKKTTFQKVVSFRVTEHQFSQINSKIKSFGINKSEIFRRITESILTEPIQENLLLTIKKQ